ncbi:MAG: carbohydrate kinase family protein [Roseiflexaceae bacterium]
MAHDYDILLLGGYFCDLIFTGLPEMPQLGAEVFGSGFEVVPGAAFTTALALQRLGLRAGWSCDFGNDFFSRYVLEEARATGLDDRLFRHHPHPLRRVTAALSFPHDRAFVSYLDPSERPAAAPLVEQYRPRWVLLSGLSYGPAHTELVAAARRVGAQVYMDCQCVSATLATPGLVEALRAVDVFAPNEREAIALTGAGSWQAALEQLAALTPLVVLKRGAAGAVARRQGEQAQAPALPVAVLDTTGAGDCFNAGFLYGYLRDRSLEESLRCGNICGGLSTTAFGGRAVPTVEQLEALLKDTEGRV